MVRFEWKRPALDEYPPEPGVSKAGWQRENPGMTKAEILEWWENHFEVYACKLWGVPGPVPVQLYYIGDHLFMSETGHTYKAGSVLAWDSYTEEE